MKASDLKPGDTFKRDMEAGVFKVVVNANIALPSYEQWSSTPHTNNAVSRRHVFAVDSDNRLVAIHPDNNVLPVEPLSHTPHAYRLAIAGEGPHAADWKDKPHRLVYDLCNEVERLRLTS